MGLQPKAGGKLHPKLNSGTRPIANKYREGKVKSTLERELKRPRNRWEGNACSRTGPRRVQGAAWSPACGRHRLWSSARRGFSLPRTLVARGRPGAAGDGRGARVGKVAQPSPSGGGGELTAGRAERPTPAEESGGTCTPAAQAASAAGALASVRSPRRGHCTQCPA